MTKKKAKQPAETKRIYVIVPETVQVPIPRTKHGILSLRMESGRLIAQVAHVTAKMRLDQAAVNRQYENITTIVLSVRNTRELLKTYGELVALDTLGGKRDPHFNVYTFEDTNPEFYGTRKRVLTAICTSPVNQSWVDGVLGHLELYK